MGPLRAWSQRWCLAAGIVAAVLGTPAAQADEVSVPVLKAAFISNFAKFTDWPPETLPTGEVFNFCVVGDKDVAAALRQTVTSHSAAPMSVTLANIDASLRRCHLVYIGNVDARQAAQMLDAVKGAAVFTVSDIGGFAELGGIAQLIQDNGHIRFAINPSAAQRARLALNARLLSLATLIKEPTDASR